MLLATACAEDGPVGPSSEDAVASMDKGKKGGLPGVAQIPVASVTVTPDAASLTVGQTQQLAAVVPGVSGHELTGQEIAWITSDATKATVSSAGLVTAVDAGSATITASAGGKDAIATITVVAPPAIALAANTISFSATAGQANPAAQTVEVTNSGGGTLSELEGTVTYREGQTAGWLKAALNSTTAPATLTLESNIASLQPGTYNAVVAIRSALTGINPQGINVTPIVASASDATAPTLTGFTFTPTSVDVSTGSASVEVTFAAADTGSGLNYLSVNFSPVGANGQSRSCQAYTPVSGTKAAGTWKCTVTIPQYSASGEWRVSSVYLADNVGNYSSIAEMQLQAAGYQTKLQVGN